MLSQSKSSDEIDSMRRAGKILAGGLNAMKSIVAPGISTLDLSEVAEKYILENGGEPAFIDYPGSSGAKPYPETACISVNDAVVHGIPGSSQKLKEGDIVSLDLGVKYKDMIVDGAITVAVGSTSDERQQLIITTKKALYAGLKQVKDGSYTGDIGDAIFKILNAKGYGVVRDLVGHGVGYSIHEDPNIPNFGKRGTGSILKSGMTVAIEPMATLGNHEVYIDRDGWTVRTRDGSTAAHFEHTILVTDKGYEVLTSII